MKKTSINKLKVPCFYNSRSAFKKFTRLWLNVQLWWSRLRLCLSALFKICWTCPCGKAIAWCPKSIIAVNVHGPWGASCPWRRAIVCCPCTALNLPEPRSRCLLRPLNLFTLAAARCCLSRLWRRIFWWWSNFVACLSLRLLTGRTIYHSFFVLRKIYIWCIWQIAFSYRTLVLSFECFFILARLFIFIL